jgi:hypothetical protein
VADSVEEHEKKINISIENQHNEKQINSTQVVANSWYDDIKFYLTHGSPPPHLYPRNRRALRLKYASFLFINDVLFRNNFDGVLMHCLEKDEAGKVLFELHAGEAGGHFGGDTTS